MQHPNRGSKLVPGFPIIEAEVVFAARHEWAIHAEDVIARRTRLAFIDKETATFAVPKVVELMGNELNWEVNRRQEETERCLKFLESFGGSNPPQNRYGTGSIENRE